MQIVVGQEGVEGSTEGFHPLAIGLRLLLSLPLRLLGLLLRCIGGLPGATLLCGVEVHHGVVSDGGQHLVVKARFIVRVSAVILIVHLKFFSLEI
jgi:hypothetical protein